MKNRLAWLRDEIYISIRVVSEQDLERADIQELIELLVIFFRLVVAMLLLVAEIARGLRETAANLADAVRSAGHEIELGAWLAWQIGVIVIKSGLYGLGVIR